MQQPLAICEHCDAVHHQPVMPRRARAYCVRCGARMTGHRGANIETLIALAAAGLVVFLIANSYPIMSLEVGSEHTRTTLLGAVAHSSMNGLLLLSSMTAICLFIFPLLQIIGTLYVLIPLQLGQRPRYFSMTMHALLRLRPWSLMEVFLLGALVALVKLDATATVIPGVGLWAFAVLTLVMTVLSSFDLHEIWDLSSELENGQAT